MKDKVFLDTNILIYAHDQDAGPKHDVALSIIKKIWETETGIISTQVIQEFYVNVTRKMPSPITPVQARGIILNYFSWQVEAVNPIRSFRPRKSKKSTFYHSGILLL